MPTTPVPLTTGEAVVSADDGIVIDYGLETPRQITRQRRDARFAARRRAGEKPKAIIVARVSAVLDRVGDSYQSVTQIQLPECRRVCNAHDFEIVEEIIHEDKKGGEVKRLLGVIDAIEQGRADVLVVWNVSRFTRRARHGHNVLHRIREAGGDLKSVEGNADIHTPEGHFLFSILLAKVEMEYDAYHANFQRVKRNAMKRGVLPFIPPFGYRRAVDPATGQRKGAWQPDPAQAPWVGKMFKWRARGWSYGRIARELMTARVPPVRGERWSVPSVRRILANAAYTGQPTYGQWDVKDVPRVPPLVANQLWLRVNNTPRTASTGGRVNDAGHLLTHFLICAGCGGSMVGDTDRAGTPIYRCNARSRATRCEQQATVRKHLIESYIVNATREFARQNLAGDFAPMSATTTDGEFEELLERERQLLEECEAVGRRSRECSSRWTRLTRCARTLRLKRHSTKSTAVRRS